MSFHSSKFWHDKLQNQFRQNYLSEYIIGPAVKKKKHRNLNLTKFCYFQIQFLFFFLFFMFM